MTILDEAKERLHRAEEKAICAQYALTAENTSEALRFILESRRLLAAAEEFVVGAIMQKPKHHETHP